MKRFLFGENLKDLVTDILKRGLILIGIVMTIQETMTGFFYNIVSKLPIINTKEKITLFMYLILIIGMIYIVAISIYELFRDEVSIKIKTHNENKIIIRLGSYENNMEKILSDIEGTDKDAIFVIGINDEVNMSLAEKRGVHKAVLDKFYSNEKDYNLLESKVNNIFGIYDSTKDRFGEIGLVDHNQNSKLMFVINSKHEEGQSTSIVGPQPTDILKNVFKNLETQSAEIVQLPILSSRNVRCFENNKIIYSVTIAEIIEEYFTQILNNRNINYDLVLSIRKQDLKENFITLNSIVKFIEELKPMYHIK